MSGNAMIINVRVLLLILVIAGLLPAGWMQPALAQDIPEGVDPAALAQEIRSSLFDVQRSLADGDTSGAAEITGLTGDVATLSALFTADPTAAADLDAQFAVAQAAVAANDPVALAMARGLMWTAMLQGAYAETIQAVQDNRPADATAWLLLREFRPTTKFERPNANATLAVHAFANGEMTAEDAILAVQADLLDTYQARLTTELADIGDAGDSGFLAVQAESAGLATGFWRILDPAYAAQMGADAAAQADAQIQALATGIADGDAAAVTSAANALVAIDRSFRAAPLSEEDQARRAGQLVRYLSLVPIEYGRGVHDGTVIVEIEISEAQAFLDGARASFDDLYLTLNAQDPAKTAEVEAAITWLEQAVGDAARRAAVADPGDVESNAQGAIGVLEGMFPDEWTRSGGQADFDVISSLLDQMETAVKAGQWEQAESARLEAYAIYELGAEKRLLAFAPGLANETEALFWGGTGNTEGLAVAISREAPASEIHDIRLALDTALLQSQERIGVGRPSNAVVIFNAGTIVFREGLEAVLILASLVASMIGANQRFKRPLIAGAGLAFLATALLFWAAQTVLHSLARYGEKLEAVVSLIAIGVLLLVMNWFFHKVYWTKWISKHHQQRRAVLGGAISGQVIGLIVLGFTSVFREGAETVLFLQALVLDAGTWVVIQGTAIGLLGTAIVGALVLVMQKKLPHKKMLTVTGVMLAFVLVVMVGNTVHVMQVVGWMPISPIPGVVFPYWMGTWFGLHATWEGMFFQAVALVVVLGSYYAAEWVNKGKFRGSESPQIPVST